MLYVYGSLWRKGAGIRASVGQFSKKVLDKSLKVCYNICIVKPTMQN